MHSFADGFCLGVLVSASLATILGAESFPGAWPWLVGVTMGYSVLRGLASLLTSSPD